jgi:hypothetical protein
MSRKQEQPSERKGKSRAPSTGLGAASAMEAMIKRRVPAPQQQHAPHDSKKH